MSTGHRDIIAEAEGHAAKLRTFIVQHAAKLPAWMKASSPVVALSRTSAELLDELIAENRRLEAELYDAEQDGTDNTCA